MASHATSVSVAAQISGVDDNRQVAAKVRAAGTSFYWAMRLQPRPKRAALFAIYGFCREVDDIADGDAGVADPVRALETWTARIDALFAREAKTPLERCLVQAIIDYNLRKDDFLAIIEGMMTDAKGPITRPSMAQLTHYCDCVASAVGRLCIRVFGDASRPAMMLANAQGQALQLTNIIRDVEEDAQRGRIYVPGEILAAHGLEHLSPKALSAHPNLALARADLGALAKEQYDAAAQAASQCDPIAIRPAMMMMDAYRHTYDRWAQNSWQRPPRNLKSSLEKRGKLMAKALKAWLNPGKA